MGMKPRRGWFSFGDLHTLQEAPHFRAEVELGDGLFWEWSVRSDERDAPLAFGVIPFRHDDERSDKLSKKYSALSDAMRRCETVLRRHRRSS